MSEWMGIVTVANPNPRNIQWAEKNGGREKKVEKEKVCDGNGMCFGGLINLMEKQLVRATIYKCVMFMISFLKL